MNWGYKIAIFYTAFAVFMLTLVVKSMNQHHDLVTENYYEKELKFQEQIDKQALTVKEKMEVRQVLSATSLMLVFPVNENVDGEIKLFCPSDAAKDFTVRANPDREGKQQLDISSFSKGKYLLQIDWKANGKAYFQETVVVL